MTMRWLDEGLFGDPGLYSVATGCVKRKQNFRRSAWSGLT